LALIHGEVPKCLDQILIQSRREYLAYTHEGILGKANKDIKKNYLNHISALPPDFFWFEAAAGICQEAVDRIRETGRFLAESKGYEM
jgi:hypothetical protein